MQKITTMHLDTKNLDSKESKCCHHELDSGEMLESNKVVFFNKRPKGVLGSIKWLYIKSERFFHLLVGVPSYDKYLEYMKTYKPESNIKTRKPFFKEALDKRYNGGTSRCC